MPPSITSLNASMKRMGAVIEPNGDPTELEGVLNPGSARTKNGELLLYPRAVAKGNESRIGTIRVKETDNKLNCERLAFALEPKMEYEFNGAVGNGCEDARITYIPVLGKYIMTYTAYSKIGPKGALAYSEDGYQWHRIGLVNFPAYAQLPGGDKDLAFFPEPVTSPSGVKSLALYHRPMALIPPQGVPEMLAMPHDKRDSIWMAYIPLEPVLKDLHNLLEVTESYLILTPSPKDKWGQLKLGGGTPPVLIEEGWLSVFHGVDAFEEDGKYKCCYKAGILIHDINSPNKIIYRSPEPLLEPETDEELVGTVNNVVFPTALDPRPDLGKRVFDVYYGMADYKIGRARLELS